MKTPNFTAQPVDRKLTTLRSASGVGVNASGWLDTLKRAAGGALSAVLN